MIAKNASKPFSCLIFLSVLDKKCVFIVRRIIIDILKLGQVMMTLKCSLNEDQILGKFFIHLEGLSKPVKAIKRSKVRMRGDIFEFNSLEVYEIHQDGGQILFNKLTLFYHFKYFSFHNSNLQLI